MFDTFSEIFSSAGNIVTVAHAAIVKNVINPVEDFIDRNWWKVEKVAGKVVHDCIDAVVRVSVIAVAAIFPIRHNLRVWLFATAVDSSGYATPRFLRAIQNGIPKPTLVC